MTLNPCVCSRQANLHEAKCRDAPYYVERPGCMACTSFYTDEEAAVAEWNSTNERS